MKDEEKITFQLFKKWLTSLIITKNGEIPDIEDWKEIKAMLDRVDDNLITHYNGRITWAEAIKGMDYELQMDFDFDELP